MSDRERRSQPSTPESEDRLLARCYMLGGLSNEQSDEVERRFLFDPAFEDIVLEEETDLFDALAAGTLSSEDDRAFRIWASARQRTQARLDAAFAFQRLSASSSGRTTDPAPGPRNSGLRAWLDLMRTPRFSALWLAGITAASLAVIAVSLWMTSGQPAAPTGASASATQPGSIAATPSATLLPSSPGDPGLPPKPSPPVATAPARPEAVATFFLMAEETRGATTPIRLHLKPGTRTVTLQLGSQTGLSAGPHTVQLTGPNGSIIRPSNVSSRSLHGQIFLEVALDASTLQSGAYTALLHQNDTTGPAPDLTYHFQIAEP